MTKLSELLATHARNQRFRHYDVAVVLVPFGHLEMLSDKHHKQRAAIASDQRLTSAGKADAVEKARKATREAIEKWHEDRLKNIDADLLEQRAGLRGNVTAPEQKRVDLMVQHLLKFKPEEVAIFYNSASDTERMEMEAASAQVGRVPLKSSNGQEWKPLLDPAMVRDAILERATTTNPEAAQKVRELSEIRSMQVTVTNVALNDL